MNHFVIKCDSLNVMKLDLFMEKPVILIVYNQLNIKEKKYRLPTRIANQTPVTLMLLCMLNMDSSTEVSLTIYTVVLCFYLLRCLWGIHCYLFSIFKLVLIWYISQLFVLNTLMIDLLHFVFISVCSILLLNVQDDVVFLWSFICTCNICICSSMSLLWWYSE